jgi:dolichyl-phosphate-mannose-protein mannosyltransferase
VIPAPANAAARSFGAALAATTLVALAVRAWGLAGQTPLADDWAAAVASIRFVERGEIASLMWHHPRLRDLLVYASTAVLGQTKLGLALPSLLAGVSSVPVLGLLGRRLAGPAAGLLAAWLVALDPLHVHYSRQAVHDVYMFLFGAAGVYLAHRYATAGTKRTLLAAGGLFGLGIASKWAVLAPLGVVGTWLVVREVGALRGPDPRGAAARAAFAVSALGVLPAAIYVLTWLPWFAHGRDLSDWIVLQRTMATEASLHTGFNPYDLEVPHQAASWFLRPTWFADFAFGPEGPVALIAVTNPVVWLTTLPAVARLAVRARRGRRLEDALLVALFCSTWLPFAIAARPIWLHSALAVLPFSLIAIAASATHLAGSGPRARVRLGAYATLVALSSAPLLLLATGAASHLAPFRPVLESFRPEERFEGGGPEQSGR